MLDHCYCINTPHNHQYLRPNLLKFGAIKRAVRLACYTTVNKKIFQILVIKTLHLLKFLNAMTLTETGE